MMTYEQTLDFLFNRLQSFHNEGAKAYKPGLEKTLRLAEAFGNPHLHFPSIHIGGTNGKGSTAHSLASVLMASGLKVGLYTSPHLIDFTERIRINGAPIDRASVIDFVSRFRTKNLTDTDPSFFELTTIMAFEYFAREKVDIAVIEVGLGGRLDSTNIITPLLSVITNVSYDHTALLGKELQQIAKEKAGIIKPGIPVVIGRRNHETDTVFNSAGGDVTFAQDRPLFSNVLASHDTLLYKDTPWGDLESCLSGDCQPENMQTILTVLKILDERKILTIRKEAVVSGIKNVVSSTGLQGRWMKIPSHPETVIDTAHNPDGWKHIASRLKRHLPSPLHIVLGFVSDKDFSSILSELPLQASYYFAKPSVNRALPAEAVLKSALEKGLKGAVYTSVAEAYNAAVTEARKNPNALVFVGGSNFVVADLLRYFESLDNKRII